MFEKYNVNIPFLCERKKNRNQWLVGFNTKFYGFPVQSAYYKEAGTGDNGVVRLSGCPFSCGIESF